LVIGHWSLVIPPIGHWSLVIGHSLLRVLKLGRRLQDALGLVRGENQARKIPAAGADGSLLDADDDLVAGQAGDSRLGR
jgi:hypothetical protein